MQPQFSPRFRKRRPKIANEIRRYRLLSGLTQHKLAKKLGVGRSTLGAWERGARWPAEDQIFDLAIHLSTMTEGLYPEAFFGKKRQLLTAAEK